jgi:hypothetical protein
LDWKIRRSSQVMFTIGCGVVNQNWRHGLVFFIYVFLWCLFLDPHQPTHQSNMSVRLRTIKECYPRTLKQLGHDGKRVYVMILTFRRERESTFSIATRRTKSLLIWGTWWFVQPPNKHSNNSFMWSKIFTLFLAQPIHKRMYKVESYMIIVIIFIW